MGQPHISFGFCGSLKILSYPPSGYIFYKLGGWKWFGGLQRMGTFVFGGRILGLCNFGYSELFCVRWRGGLFWKFWYPWARIKALENWGGNWCDFMNIWLFLISFLGGLLYSLLTCFMQVRVRRKAKGSGLEFFWDWFHCIFGQRFAL